MDIYTDTEFTQFQGDLISFALVPSFDHINALYVVLGDDQFEEPSEWVKENVMPKLRLEGAAKLPCKTTIAMGVTREVAARMVAAYLRQFDRANIVADWPEDFAQLLMLLVTGPGEMVNVPDFDISYRALRGFNTADVSGIPHNALYDAVALRDYCEGQK